MKKKRRIIIFLIVTGIVLVNGLEVFAEDSGYFLIDDFTASASSFGTSWEGFSDQVMGGRSEIAVVRIPSDDEPYIRMSGDVSLERNGGFIQIRLKFIEKGNFDASDFKGIRLKVRGKDLGYYVFLRTSATILPWKFYKAPVEVTEEWKYIDIPWSEFTGGDYGGIKPLNIKKLKSMAISAYGREFNAEIEVSEVGLYK